MSDLPTINMGFKRECNHCGLYTDQSHCPICGIITKALTAQPAAPARACTGIEAELCQEIAERQAKGIAKYGQTVAENPLELRAWLQHALEETLDNAVYLKRTIAEIDKQHECASTNPA